MLYNTLTNWASMLGIAMRHTSCRILSLPRSFSRAIGLHTTLFWEFSTKGWVIIAPIQRNSKGGARIFFQNRKILFSVEKIQEKEYHIIITMRGDAK